MDTLGKRIIELRRALGLQQQQFAKALGWADNAHSKLSIIEKDKSKPAYDFLETVLNAFPQVNPVWLIKGTSEMFLGDYKPEVLPAPTEKKKVGKIDEATEKLIALLEAELNDAKREKQQLLEILSK